MPILPESPRWYRRPEAAASLIFSLRTLDRLIASKEIAVRRVGRLVYITEESITQFKKRDHNTGGTPGGDK
jgi:excisionase family DNA binding protein